MQYGWLAAKKDVSYFRQLQLEVWIKMEYKRIAHSPGWPHAVTCVIPECFSSWKTRRNLVHSFSRKRAIRNGNINAVLYTVLFLWFSNSSTLSPPHSWEPVIYTLVIVKSKLKPPGLRFLDSWPLSHGSVGVHESAWHHLTIPSAFPTCLLFPKTLFSS